MIEWFLYTQVFLALAVGLLCLVLGFIGKEPNDLSMGAMLLLGLALIGQIVVAAVAPATGNHSHGPLLEFWMYLIAAFLLPFLGMAWGLMVRTRWSTLVLGVIGLAVSVMVYRMGVLWF